MIRPSPLALLITTLWADARLWPPAAAARLPETRALAQHTGLATPAREHDAFAPDPRTFLRLLRAAAPELQALPRGLELEWLLTLLEAEFSTRPGGL